MPLRFLVSTMLKKVSIIARDNPQMKPKLLVIASMKY